MRGLLHPDWCGRADERLGRFLAWLLISILVVTVPACGGQDEPTPEVPSSSADSLVATPTRLSNPSFVPVEPTDAPVLDSLSAAPTLPAPAPTPFPDERGIVNAVLGQGEGDHWVAYPTEGSFTVPEADERVALVGNMGQDDEIRWVVVGRAEEGEGWQLLGVSEWLGAGFDAPPPFYLPPDILDFNHDGQQEILNHYFRMRGGWITGADAIYQWDGHRLARIWHIDTALDNTAADSQAVPQSYRQNYRCEWEWVGLDGILARENITFYADQGTQLEGNLPILGEESWQREFCWDQKALRPCALDGPFGTFAYTTLGELWVWHNRRAHPLGVKDVQEFIWSPDGLRLASWAQPSTGDDSGISKPILGVYDVETDDLRKFHLEEVPLTLSWLSEDRLACAFSVEANQTDQFGSSSVVLIDPVSGRLSELSNMPAGLWSPDGDRILYERDGGIYVYDVEDQKERPLVLGLAEPAEPVWSSEGDWVTYDLRRENVVWPGLVSSDIQEPLNGPSLLASLNRRVGEEVCLAWSSDDARVAALIYDSQSTQQPATLYVAGVPVDGGGSIGQRSWQTVTQLDTVTQSYQLAWSTDGEWLTLAAGQEVWDISMDEETFGESTLRYRFSIPDPEWTMLEWAPGGDGFLIGLEWGYGEHLFWFSSDGDEPILLLATSLGEVSWSPRVVESEMDLEMVMVDYTAEDPVFHFVREDARDVIVSAMGEVLYTPFQVAGERVYYDYRYAHRRGADSLVIPDVAGNCRPPVVSPDAENLAWLCEESPPDWSALVENTAEIPFHLVLTDGEGNDPREVWSYVETGPDYRNIQLLSWRADGQVIYMSQPKYGAAWAYFEYNPGVLALDLDTGQVTQIGDLENVHDAQVNSDGTWLVQSKVEEDLGKETVSIELRSLIDETERSIECAEGATVAGDFTFSLGSAWLAWREWAQAPGGSMLLIRAVRLPDGEPFTVYGDIEDAAPKIGGWLRQDDLVLVYPVRQDGTGGHSTFITLPGTGQGTAFSPYTFVGVLRRD